MSTLLLLQQLLILFAMALCGFGITRAGLLSETGRKQFAALIVHLFNPLLILSSVCNYDASEARGLVGQNFALAMLVHTFLFAAGFLYARLLRLRRRERSLYTMAIGMNNIAYMGIPLIRGSLGEEYVIFIAFYILFFNVLVYTLGVHLARNMADNPAPFSARGLLNIGTITSLVAILLFLFRLRPPAPVTTFLGYMGNVTIPLSMIVIGSSIAQQNLREIFLDRRNYLFVAVKMLLIPAVGILVLRNLPFDRNVLTVGFVLLSMPTANIVAMLSSEYGGHGDQANVLITLTTILSVLTVPLLSLLY